MKSKILILDEPNNGFDPVHEKRIFNLLSVSEIIGFFL